MLPLPLKQFINSKGSRTPHSLGHLLSHLLGHLLSHCRLLCNNSNALFIVDELKTCCTSKKVDRYLTYQLKRSFSTMEWGHTLEDGMYIRGTHAAQNECAAALCKQYDGAVGATLFPSGNAACWASVQACLQLFKKCKQPVVVLHAAELYTDSCKMLAALNATKVDTEDKLKLQETVDAIDKQTPVVYFVETHSNPSGLKPSVEFLHLLAKRFSLLHVVFDNTMLTSHFCNPFTQYKDVLKPSQITVACSASKHYSAGETIAGFAVYGNKKMVSCAINVSTSVGYHTTPKTCRLILSALESLSDRCTASSAAAKTLSARLGDYITKNSLAARVLHVEPADVFLVTLQHNKPQLTKHDLQLKVAECQPLLTWATSYGGSDTRIDSYPVITPTTCTFRVAVGYNYSDVCGNALEHVCGAALERVLAAFAVVREQ